MKLVAFDGDDTLWEPLDVITLSERTPTDAEGWPHFTFAPMQGTPMQGAPMQDNSLLVVRDDGPRFALRPEAHSVLGELKRRGLLLGVISYNHEGNVLRILDAFGVLPYFDYVVGEWHSNKDKMLERMLRQAQDGGHSVTPSEAMLVDDDPYQLYRGQCERLGAGFSCFGTDIHSLDEVLHLLHLPDPSEGEAGSS